MTVPESQARDVVVQQVHCRRCGYSLYGLRADGVCPECGLETWQTILHTVDPAASKLPRLHNPAAVGDGLLWLLGCLLLLTGLLALRPLAAWLDALDERGLRSLSGWVPAELGLLAPLLALAALWGLRRMAPAHQADDGERVWRNLWLIGVGLVGGAVGLAVLAVVELVVDRGPLPAIVRLALTVPALVGLIGLGGLLRDIGLRSREYRTARGGRQGTLAMVGALAGVAIGGLLRVLGHALADERQVITLGRQVIGVRRVLVTAGTVVATISVLMLVIGLAYLTVNVWWIRRALRRPSPRLGEILGTERPGSQTR